MSFQFFSHHPELKTYLIPFVVWSHTQLVTSVAIGCLVPTTCSVCVEHLNEFEKDPLQYPALLLCTRHITNYKLCITIYAASRLASQETIGSSQPDIFAKVLVTPVGLKRARCNHVEGFIGNCTLIRTLNDLDTNSKPTKSVKWTENWRTDSPSIQCLPIGSDKSPSQDTSWGIGGNHLKNGWSLRLTNDRFIQRHRKKTARIHSQI